MTAKRFSIKAGSSIGLSSIYTDNGKIMTQLEVLDVLIKQYETIQTLTKENDGLKQKLELYGELYPTGKWITKLTSEELEKELEE